MKGDPVAPKCGFSRQTVELFESLNVEYATFDILSDDEVRQGLKTFSNWPTYPQLYIDGELIGGLDILKEMHENKELESVLPKKKDLNTTLKSLINKAPVMVFMKGDPETPKCGFRYVPHIKNVQIHNELIMNGTFLFLFSATN